MPFGSKLPSPIMRMLGNEMTADSSLPANGDVTAQWYETEVQIRGCAISLPLIKSAYRAYQNVVNQEGEALLRNLIKPDDKSQDEFDNELNHYRNHAFRLTISIIGVDGVTFYGETEAAFDNPNLPNPVARVFFTNVTAFRRNANGNEPKNKIEVWLDFEKRPLFDTTTIVSDPTPNGSRVLIKAEDLRFFSAMKNITIEKFISKKTWYSFIHSKLSYDYGLYTIAFPYAFYASVVITERISAAHQAFSPFKLPAFIYLSYLFLIGYRALFGYAKWAYPVNTLKENHDTPAAHRVVIGGLLLGLLGWLIKSAWSLAVSPIAGL